MYNIAKWNSTVLDQTCLGFVSRDIFRQTNSIWGIMNLILIHSFKQNLRILSALDGLISASWRLKIKIFYADYHRRSWTLCSISNFLILKSLQPYNANLWYHKLWLFKVTVHHFRKIGECLDVLPRTSWTSCRTHKKLG